jgi:hypothetical protein
VTTLAHARKLALALPEATEQDHHGLASFRIRGKIFATVPDKTHLRVMVDEMEIRAAVAENPTACQELYWGRKLAAVVVDLPVATSGLVQDLLTDAWIRKAPSKLVRELGDG